ncbi:MAG: DUF3108 domain-containing protein [Myxococcales bacterium]
MRAHRFAAAALALLLLAGTAVAAEKAKDGPGLPRILGRGLLPPPGTQPAPSAPATQGEPAVEAAPANLEACAPLPRIRSGPPPFAAGEVLQYDIDVVGVRAGKLSFEVLPKVGTGSAAEYPLRARAQSNTFFDKVRKVNSEIVTHLRARDLHPRVFHEDLTEGTMSRTADVTFSDKEKLVNIEWKTKSGASGRSKHTYSADALDYVGGIYFFRGLNLKVGQSICFESYAMRRMWHVTGVVEAREQITTPAGVFNAFHLKGKARRLGGAPLEREFHIWISDDERRLPVAAMGIIDLGPVRATLVEVNRGDYKTAAARPGNLSW